MAKFILEGLSTPLVGEVISDDGLNVLVRDEFGEDVEIPRSRIIMVRKGSASAPRKPIIKTGDASPMSPVSPPEPSQDVKPDGVSKTPKEVKNEIIRDAFKSMVESKKKKRSSGVETREIMRSDAKVISGLSQIDPPPDPLTYDPDKKAPVDVVFEGAKNHAFRLNLPVELMSRGYTPALGREIFQNPEVKTFVNQIVLTSVPEVQKDKIVYQTGHIRDQGVDVANKLGVAAKTMAMASSLGGSAGSTFKKPERSFETDFAMKTSPFEELPLIKQSGEDK